MERYGSNHLGAHSCYSSYGLSATPTEQKHLSSFAEAELDTEEQDTQSQCSDIGAARSPHHLAVSLRTLRHFTNEKDKVDTSESSRNLLSGPDSDIDVPNSGNSGLAATTTYGVSTPNKSSNFLRKLPWMVLLSFLGSLACTAGSIVVLIVSNNATQASWSIQPSVYLAALAPFGNLSLQYCLSQRLANDWWNLASRRTTLGALDNRWEHGTSILSAATSFSAFNKIAAAKILFAATFAVNPLQQRASLPYTNSKITNVTVPFHLATNQSSSQSMDFRDTSIGMFSTSGWPPPPLFKVLRDYTNRAPLINRFGTCPGNCTGTVRAAGLDGDCRTYTQENYAINYQELIGLGGTVFRTNSFYSSLYAEESPSLNLQILFVQTELGNNTSLNATLQSCTGVATEVVCTMTPATMEYPIVLRGNVISVDTRNSSVKAL